MHSLILSLAFFVAARAAPVSISQGRESVLDQDSNILIGRSGYVVIEEGAEKDTRSTELRSRGSTDYEIEVTRPVSGVATSISVTYTSTPTPSASGLPYGTTIAEDEAAGEEDPQISRILDHIEDILDSNASADEQIAWILDAILHPTESLRESHEDLWGPSDILSLVDEISRDDVASDEDKVEIIFNQILQHTKHKEKVETQVHEPALYRIRAILYGPESSQKKIKKILNEIADYLDPESSTAEAGYASQVTFGDGQDESAQLSVDDIPANAHSEGSDSELEHAGTVDR